MLFADVASAGAFYGERTSEEGGGSRRVLRDPQCAVRGGETNQIYGGSVKLTADYLEANTSVSAILRQESMPPDLVLYMTSWATRINSLRLPKKYRTVLESIIVPLSDLTGRILSLRAATFARRRTLPSPSALVGWEQLYHRLHTSTARSLDGIRAELVRAHATLNRASPMVVHGVSGSCAHDVALILAQKAAGFVTYTIAPIVLAAGNGGPAWAKLRERLAESAFADIDVNVLYALMAEEALSAGSKIWDATHLPATDTGVGRQEIIAALERETPALDIGNGQWVKNKTAAKLDGISVASLATYRNKGVRRLDGMLGRDPNGRVWRRSGTKACHPWYLASTLTSHAR